jgi:phage terminase large subunit
VVDAYAQAGLGPVPVNFSGKADDPRYFNKRSEMWFRMRDWIRAGGCLPNVPELARELVAPTYTFQGGKFRLEEKEHVKSRLGHSTDYSDSLALTFHSEDVPAESPIEAWKRKQGSYKLEYEFDPFDDDR